MFWGTSKSNKLNHPEDVNMSANPAQSCMARQVLRTNTKVIGRPILLWISEKRGQRSLTSRPKCRTLPSRGGPSERQVCVPIMGDPDHNPLSKGLTVLMLKGIYRYLFAQTSLTPLSSLLILPRFLEIGWLIPYWPMVRNQPLIQLEPTKQGQLAVSLQPQEMLGVP